MLLFLDSSVCVEQVEVLSIPPGLVEARAMGSKNMDLGVASLDDASESYSNFTCKASLLRVCYRHSLVVCPLHQRLSQAMKPNLLDPEF